MRSGFLRQTRVPSADFRDDVTAQVASAFAFISRSTSAYRFVVSRETWPSQARMVLMSTPDLSRCTAVVCLTVCGLIRFACSDGSLGTARTTVRSTSAWMPKRVNGLPRMLRKIGVSGGSLTRWLSRLRSTLTVWHQRGQMRVLFPLPRIRTQGEESRLRSSTVTSAAS